LVLVAVRRRHGLVLLLRRGPVFALPARPVTDATEGRTALGLAQTLLWTPEEVSLELRAVHSSTAGGRPLTAFLFVTPQLADDPGVCLPAESYVWSRTRRPSVPLDRLGRHIVPTLFHMAVPTYDEVTAPTSGRGKGRPTWNRKRARLTAGPVPSRYRLGYRRQSWPSGL
jgi:hypothetical protein